MEKAIGLVDGASIISVRYVVPRPPTDTHEACDIEPVELTADDTNDPVAEDIPAGIEIRNAQEPLAAGVISPLIASVYTLPICVYIELVMLELDIFTAFVNVGVYCPDVAPPP